MVNTTILIDIPVSDANKGDDIGYRLMNVLGCVIEVVYQMIQLYPIVFCHLQD